MKKILCFALSILLIFYGTAFALELVRQKNVATKILVPIVDADGDIVTGAAGLDTELTYWDDGTSAVNWTDLTAEATELQESGWYELGIAQGEMNHDYIALRVQTSTSGAKTQHVLVRTIVGDPLLAATTDDGGTINVTGGAIDSVTALSATGNTAVIDEFESQSATDPTGFKVNVMEVNGTAQTANDNGADINAILTDTDAYDTDAEYATALWNAAVASYGTSGTYGLLIETDLDAAISSRSTLTAANVWETNISAYSGAGYAGTYLKDLYDNQGDWVTATSVGLTAAAVDAVWDELTADHVTAGTMGKALGDAGDPWATDIPGSYSGDDAGYILPALIKRSRGR